MAGRMTMSERKAWLRQLLLNQPDRQPPMGWWQDDKGNLHPPGTYEPLPPRPKGPKAKLEARRDRRFGASPPG
ncbi:MAG: hypothetical protein M0T71_05125 [Actinomycetota bacterium]|nr:hypothetical protein [Actinomycetota bacterium]